MGRKRHAVGDPDGDATEYQAGGDPLLTALFEGDVEGARQLLEGGRCDIEAADQLGWRPLHRAAFGGFSSLVAALLERRADAVAADREGLQPLHIAAAGGHADCCRHLLEARADPTAPEAYSGMSAQMYTLIQEGEVGKLMQEVLGVPDLARWAASGDPLAMARHAACLDATGAKEALEAHWAAELAAGDGAADGGGSDGEEEDPKDAQGEKAALPSTRHSPVAVARKPSKFVPRWPVSGPPGFGNLNCLRGGQQCHPRPVAM